jgi:hypothetical protein
MDTPDERRGQEQRSERFKFLGLESLISEIESAQHRSMEREQICCESRIQDEIFSAACDCHGDSCCC